MAPEDFQAILARLRESDPFRDLFLFLWHSGCRPQEARHIDRHVQLDQERIVIPKEEAKGKRYPRVIYLHGPALEIVTRLMAVGAEGKLFRNTRGCAGVDEVRGGQPYAPPFPRNGRKMALYDARQGFATRKLVLGHDRLTIAELVALGKAQ